MYNFFKYQQIVRQQQAQRKQEQQYSQWLLTNQDIKQTAKQKQKQKLHQWAEAQMQNGVKHHFQDDHHKKWRFLKQFRDVQHQDCFKGYKTFRHKPSSQMNKYFNQRERIEIRQLAKRKQPLLQNQIIHKAHISRSLRSQGPLHPKIEFRKIKKDHEYLQPRLRFHNVTDKDRMNETQLTFDDKFKSLYSSFQLKKSSLGVPKISRLGNQQNLNYSISKPISNRYDSDVISQKSFKLKGHSNNKVYFDSKNYDNQEDLSQSKQFISADISERMPEIKTRQNSLGRTYFKLAKTMQMNGSTHLKQLLIDSQYDRKKDLSNIKHNKSGQNYYKRPIL